jgi:predicted transcriptional regulator
LIGLFNPVINNMSSTPSIDASSSISSATETVEKTRLLLTLWAMSCTEGTVKKSELTSKVKQKRKGKNVGVSQSLYDELQAADVIKIYKQNQTPMVSLTDTGKQILIDSLINPDFVFDATVVAARLANGLIALIRELHQGGIPLTSVKQVTIASYEEFKAIALQVYDQLNKDYNYDNLVPIYRIRRTIGDQVSRSQFSEWMLEMQANDVFQLMEGSVEDSAPDKIEDSITTELGRLRCYAKQL